MYFGIFASLPSHWKTHLTERALDLSTPNPNTLCFTLFTNNSSRNKVIYSTLVKRIVERPHCITKWHSMFSSEFNWNRIFFLPFKAVENSKIRYFQFRFLHRILGTNTFLHKIGYFDSPLCSFCKLHDETLSHLFYDCFIVKTFWHEVVAKTLQDIDIVNLDKVIVFFGLISNLYSPLNFFILHTKYYIYSCRTRQILPNVNQFVRKFSFHLQVRRHILDKKHAG